MGLGAVGAWFLEEIFFMVTALIDSHFYRKDAEEITGVLIILFIIISVIMWVYILRHILKLI